MKIIFNFNKSQAGRHGMSQEWGHQRVQFVSGACLVLALPGVLGLWSCGGDAGAKTAPVEVPDSYAFESRFGGGSSVAYEGQTLRQVLIKTTSDFIGGLSQRIDSGDFVPEPGDVRAILESYYAFDSKVSGQEAIELEADLPLLQKNFDQLASGKDLQGKYAGNGGDVEHRDWKSEFRGYAGVKGAEALLFRLFDRLDALAVARANGQYEIDATVPVFITAEGEDLHEFIGKMLLMGTAYSQATDKYLDEALESEKNTQSDEDGAKQPFTGLEHAWDEAFGYLGAARDYASYSDEGLAGLDDEGGPFKDSNKDGQIDLTSEMNFGLAVYAAKRDLDSHDKTDFTGDLWTAFATGRAIIAQAGDALSAGERAALAEQRDAAVEAWESVIAASIVHYLNESIASLRAAESGEFELTELAEPFSELKAFSLGLQFNPRSRLAGKDFDTFQANLGDAPVLPEAGMEQVDAYIKKLLAARDILQAAYGFSDANVGDDAGQGGW